MIMNEDEEEKKIDDNERRKKWRWRGKENRW